MNLSIIIPVYNEAARIGKLVTFLRAHSHPATEILVVDGGSTDGTLQVSTEAGAKVISCTVCSRAAQMNTGAQRAQGDILYFIHADTCPPTSFEADIQAALDTGFAMGCYRYRFDSTHFLLKVNAYFNRFHWLWCQGGDKTFFIRREIFEKFDGYDEYYTIMEEYDFLRRAMPQHTLYIIPKYAIVSARKYVQNGWLRVQLANMIVFNMFRLGAAPKTMKHIYRSLLR